MGNHYKIYLTNVEARGLELLQEKVEKEGGNSAANALFKKALRKVMVEAGVLEWVKMGPSSPPLLQVAKPKPEPVVEPVVAPRRRRRRG